MNIWKLTVDEEFLVKEHICVGIPLAAIAELSGVSKEEIKEQMISALKKILRHVKENE